MQKLKSSFDEVCGTLEEEKRSYIKWMRAIADLQIAEKPNCERTFQSRSSESGRVTVLSGLDLMYRHGVTLRQLAEVRESFAVSEFYLGDTTRLEVFR